jgi:hypothetical protein
MLSNNGVASISQRRLAAKVACHPLIRSLRHFDEMNMPFWGLLKSSLEKSYAPYF